MLFFQEWYRNKKFTGTLAALFAVFLLGPARTFAASNNGTLVYKTSLGLDLDGDHIPETVTVRQSSSFYQVSIHFSTGRPKLRLRTYVAGDVAGLKLEVADINNDSEADLVVTSATSTSPVAAWLNHGAANFHRISVRKYSFWGRYNGPRLKRTTSGHRDPDGGLTTDRLPQAEIASSFGPCTGLQNFIASATHSSPDNSCPAEVTSRGPPSAPHI